MSKSNAMHVTLAAAAAVTTLFISTASHADEREQCASSADQAQSLRDEGKYRRAREQFLLCARDVCPGPIKRDCLDWLTKLDEVAPSIVFTAKDGATGSDVSDVKVSMDGVQLTERLDGKPIPVDTGEHTFKFERGGQAQEQKVLVGAGQKSRNITVQFGGAAGPGPAPGPAPGPSGGGEKSEGSLVPAFVVGGIGVLALGSFAFFGISGKNAVDDLKACKPFCEESEVDKARTKLILADISLGVGIVALGVATYMFITRPKIEDHVKVGRALPPPPKGPLSNVKVDLAPLTGGAAASFGATF
jgi:hypothetical protein